MCEYEVRRTHKVTPDGQYEWVYHVDSNCCIPYHSNTKRYTEAINTNEDAYRDLFVTHFFDIWYLEMTAEVRTTIRKETLLYDINANEIIARFEGRTAQRAVADMFVTFPQAIPTCCDTVKNNTKEENMNEFYTERSALQTAARNAFYAKETEAMKHFYIAPDKPKTIREALEWIEKKHYKALEDKELDRKLDGYEDPLDHIEFRKHPADPDGYAAARDKADKAYKAVRLDIDVLPPTEALGKVRTFESTVYH